MSYFNNNIELSGITNDILELQYIQSILIHQLNEQGKMIQSTESELKDAKKQSCNKNPCNKEIVAESSTKEKEFNIKPNIQEVYDDNPNINIFKIPQPEWYVKKYHLEIEQTKERRCLADIHKNEVKEKMKYRRH
jgi:hypothetical protein